MGIWEITRNALKTNAFEYTLKIFRGAEKNLFVDFDSRKYPKLNISENSQPHSTSKVTNESLPLQLLFLSENYYKNVQNFETFT